MSTTDLPGPSLLAGRYRLIERLGAGGMSVVWRGFDEVLGRQVAVKVLPQANSTDPSFRRRLRAEAQAAARLSHPHITNVYDYGEAASVDGSPMPFVVMELVDGESLASVLARIPVLPWPAAVRICAEVAAALAAAHARGIVHRDVTPANVMLTASGAKVVDFGISALIGENDIDPDGSLLGTPAYLAPERLDGGQVSPATDVYAVGLLIYRTLIGQLPWDVGTTTALLRAHQYTEPEPLPPVQGLPSAVDALVGRCLEKLPDDRPSSAELAHVLAGVVAQGPTSSPLVGNAGGSGDNTTILPWRHGPAAGSHPSVTPPAAPSVTPSVAARASFGAVYGAPVSGGPASGAPVSGAVVSSAASGSVPGGVVPGGTGDPAADDATGTGPVPAVSAAGHDGVSVRSAAFDLGSSKLTPGGAVPGGAVPVPAQRAGGSASAAGARSAARADAGLARVSTRRRRALVAVGAVAAVGAAGFGWVLWTDEQPRDGMAQAAEPGPRGCVVTYSVLADAGKKFKAGLTVTNNAAAVIEDWNLRFVLPGDQKLAGHGGLKLQQHGHDVVATSSEIIHPGRTVVLDMSGGYQRSNAVPVAFALNGLMCDALVSSRPGAPARPVRNVAGRHNPGGVPGRPGPDGVVPILSTAPDGVVVTLGTLPPSTSVEPTVPVTVTTTTNPPNPPLIETTTTAPPTATPTATPTETTKKNKKNKIKKIKKKIKKLKASASASVSASLDPT